MVRPVNGADQPKDSQLTTLIVNLIQMECISIFISAVVSFFVIVAISQSINLWYFALSVGITTCVLVLINVILVIYLIIQRS